MKSKAKALSGFPVDALLRWGASLSLVLALVAALEWRGPGLRRDAPARPFAVEWVRLPRPVRPKPAEPRATGAGVAPPSQRRAVVRPPSGPSPIATAPPRSAPPRRGVPPAVASPPLPRAQAIPTPAAAALSGKTSPRLPTAAASEVNPARVGPMAPAVPGPGAVAQADVPTRRTAAVPPPPAAAAPRVVAATHLDQGFRLLHPVPVAYPTLARRLRRSGIVELEVEVAPDGRVAGVVVLAESGTWGFGRAAQAAYRRARFSPPTVAGQPVRVLWRKWLRFEP